ncbi:AraC family transcriptional regulator [Halomonas shantousis]
MVEKGTISVRLVHEALQAPGQRGIDPFMLLRKAGIETAVLDEPDSRVSAFRYAALWRTVAACLDDEYFGMNDRPLRRGSFAFLCRSSLAYARLGDALAHHLGFLSLMLDDMPAMLQRHGDLAEIRLGERGAPRRAFSYFTYWMIVHGIACWLVGRRIPILAVELRSAPPAYCQDYRIMFGENLRFSRPVTRIILAAGYLDLPIKRTQAELGRFLARAPANILVRYRDPDSLASRIKAYLRQRPAHTWPGADGLARELHMSPSTLRRHLKRSGGSYQALKDSVRKESAIALLAESTLCFEEIAGQLGFADASSFYRAFQRWTGSNPGHYRSLAQGEGRARSGLMAKPVSHLE